MEFNAGFGDLGSSKPLDGANVTVSVGKTSRMSVWLEKKLINLGARVKLFGAEGQTHEEYWLCAALALDWGPSGGRHYILDQSGHLALLLKEGVKAEQEFASSGTVPDPSRTHDVSFKALLWVIGEGLNSDPFRYHKIKAGIVGAIVENSACATMLGQVGHCGTPTFPVLIVPAENQYANNLTGACQSLPDDLMKATNVMIPEKVALVGSYGDTGRGCAAALKQAGARVIVSEIDPVCALQATMEGIQVRTWKDVVSEFDIFIATTGFEDMIMVDDLRKMKDDVIICNFDCSVIPMDMLGLETFPGVKRTKIGPVTDRWVFSYTGKGIIVLDEGRPMNLSCASVSPISDTSPSLHVSALLDLWNERNSGKYENKVYDDFAKNLDQKVASVHLERLVETNQAQHICVQVEGDQQPANNRIGAVQFLKVCAAMIPFLTLLVAVAKWVFGGDLD